MEKRENVQRHLEEPRAEKQTRGGQGQESRLWKNQEGEWLGEGSWREFRVEEVVRGSGRGLMCV